MKIVIDEKNEWWICAVTGCKDEIAYGGSRFGTGVVVCHFHSQSKDTPITSVPLDEEEGLYLEWDETENEWWLGQWYDGSILLAIGDRNFKTLAEAFKAWKEGDYSLEKNK